MITVSHAQHRALKAVALMRFKGRLVLYLAERHPARFPTADDPNCRSFVDEAVAACHRFGVVSPPYVQNLTHQMAASHLKVDAFIRQPSVETTLRRSDLNEGQKLYEIQVQLLASSAGGA